MPNGTIDPQLDYLATLTPDAALRWPTVSKAKTDAIALQKLLRDKLREFTSDDVDVVVFGSLARREWSSGSDVDWTLLIDGQAKPEHRIAAREVENTLKQQHFNGAPLKLPGAEGIFGNMAFSHQIVHHIGGQADTNRNTTQRVLLLLEAVALREPAQGALGPFERIVRQVLNRYLVSDSNYHSKAEEESRIPRFLLNDIVRYWRTICVDFAYKDWEQAGYKWALRNVKLRTSRKLLFVAGLLTTFSCFRNDSLRRDGADRDAYLLKVQSHVLKFVHATPLNILSYTLSQLGIAESCRQLLDRYERFLALLDDKDTREHLEKLSDDVYKDERFLTCRELSHEIQALLKKVFFVDETPLREFTLEYGVF